MSDTWPMRVCSRGIQVGSSGGASFGVKTNRTERKGVNTGSMHGIIKVSLRKAMNKHHLGKCAAVDTKNSLAQIKMIPRTSPDARRYSAWGNACK